MLFSRAAIMLNEFLMIFFYREKPSDHQLLGKNENSLQNQFFEKTKLVWPMARLSTRYVYLPAGPCDAGIYAEEFRTQAGPLRLLVNCPKSSALSPQRSALNEL